MLTNDICSVFPVEGGGLPEGDGGADGAEAVVEDTLLVETSDVDEGRTPEVVGGGGTDVGGGGGGDDGAAPLVEVGVASLLVGGREGAMLVEDAGVEEVDELLIGGSEDATLVEEVDAGGVEGAPAGDVDEAALVEDGTAGEAEGSLVGLDGAREVVETLVSVMVVSGADSVGHAGSVVNVLCGGLGKNVGISVLPEYGPPGGPKDGSSGPNGPGGPKE